VVNPGVLRAAIRYEFGGHLEKPAAKQLVAAIPNLKS
jgi:hypothetical protein